MLSAILILAVVGFVVTSRSLPLSDTRLHCTGKIVSPAGTEIVSRIYQRYLDWAEHLTPSRFWFLVRAFAVLAFPLATCGFTFVQFNSRRLAAQWAAALLGLFMALELPLELIPMSRAVKGWMVAFCVLGLVALPWNLSWLLARHEHCRKRIAGALYCILGLLFIINLWRS